jgi:hypothetical protein
MDNLLISLFVVISPIFCLHHYFASDTKDSSIILFYSRLRSELNPMQDASGGKKISINDLVIKVSFDVWWFLMLLFIFRQCVYLSNRKCYLNKFIVGSSHNSQLLCVPLHYSIELIAVQYAGCSVGSS